MQKQFYFIEDVAAIFGMTVAAVQGQLARRQYDAIPAPVKLGRRLAWPVQIVDDFVESKIQNCLQKQNVLPTAPSKPSSVKTGRPTKREGLKRQQGVSHE